MLLLKRWVLKGASKICYNIMIKRVFHMRVGDATRANININNVTVTPNAIMHNNSYI